jgi:hypothetical protein
MQTDAATATAHIEDSSADKPHRASFDRVVPLLKWRNEVVRVKRRNEPVVALNDFHCALSGDSVRKERSPDVPAGIRTSRNLIKWSHRRSSITRHCRRTSYLGRVDVRVRTNDDSHGR